MRVRALVLVATIAAASSALGATANATGADTFYLRNDGIPMATLTERPPKAGDLTNFDPGRDISPGLLLERTPKGIEETDDAKYQHWQTDIGSMTLSGTPTLVVWASLKDFDATKVGVFTAYLLDCPEWGYDCTTLGAKEHTLQLRPTDVWVETMVTFPEVNYEISEDRALGITIVASDESEDDLLIAYDRLNYRSRLVFTSQPLAAAAPGEAQDVAPLDEPVSVAEATVTANPVTDIVEPSGASGGDQGLNPLWEWLISVGVSALMLGTLAVVLLESLSRGGNHSSQSGRGPGWLRFVPGSQRMSISIHPTDDSLSSVVTRRN